MDLPEDIPSSCVVVVDDKPSSLDLLSAILEGEGYRNVHALTDSREVMATLERVDPDIVILDLMMPHLDGFAVMRKIRRARPTDFLPILVMTGATDPSTRQRALEEGASDFLTKPFDHAEAVLRIRNLLVARHLYRTQSGHADRLRREVRQRADELRENEIRFRSVLEELDLIAVHSHQRDGTVTFWNRGCENVFGLSADRALGTNVDELIHSREERSKIAEAIDDLIRREQRAVSHEIEARCVDGRRRYLHSTLTAINRPGRDPEVFRFHIDLTDRKENERQLREQSAILQQTRDAIMILSGDGRVEYWNQGAERIYGVKPQDAIGRPLGDLISPVDQDLPALLEEVCEQGRWAGELTSEPGGGEPVIAESRWTLAESGNGSGPVILRIDFDITAARRMQMQIERNQRLETLGELAGGIAHDLNNVLAPILISASLLQKDGADARRFARIIEQSASRGAEMVRGLLTFARGSQQGRTPMLVPDLIEEMEKMIRGSFPRNIDVAIALEPDLPEVTGNRSQIYQVLLNLCVNARDAMPDGGSLQITARQVQLDRFAVAAIPKGEPGPYVEIAVEDTGQGIEPAILERIFDPFFTTKEAGHGTGLGLSTAIGIIRSHRGSLTAYSEPGTGTRFVVRLPVAPPEDGSGTASGDGDGGVRQFEGNGEAILVVDDEESIREALSVLLASMNLQPIVAGDGSEALIRLGEHREQIRYLMTDLNMPEMDGLSLIRVIRKCAPGVRIVGMSGIMDQDREQKLRDLGVNQFLDKPFNPSDVHRALLAVQP